MGYRTFTGDHREMVNTESIVFQDPVTRFSPFLFIFLPIHAHLSFYLFIFFLPSESFLSSTLFTQYDSISSICDVANCPKRRLSLPIVWVVSLQAVYQQ